jgi:hypothetical protein
MNNGFFKELCIDSENIFSRVRKLLKVFVQIYCFCNKKEKSLKDQEVKFFLP